MIQLRIQKRPDLITSKDNLKKINHRKASREEIHDSTLFFLSLVSCVIIVKGFERSEPVLCEATFEDVGD